MVDIRSCLVCTHHKTITMYTLHCIHMGNVFLGKYLDLELTSKRIYILNFDKQYEIFLWKRLYQSMSVPTVYRSLHYLISLILLLLLPPYFPNLWWKSDISLLFGLYFSDCKWNFTSSHKYLAICISFLWITCFIFFLLLETLYIS